MSLYTGFAVDKHLSELNVAADVNGVIIGPAARRARVLQNLYGFSNPPLATERERRVTRLITNTELEALAASPVEIIAAPGAGKMIHVLWQNYHLHFNGDAQDDAAADGNLQLIYTGGTPASSVIEADGLVDATADRLLSSTEGWAPTILPDNLAVLLDNNGAEFTGGDSTMTIEVIYRVIDLAFGT